MLRSLFRNKKRMLLRKKAKEVSNKKQQDLQQQKQVSYFSEEADDLKRRLLEDQRELTMYDLLKNNINISDVADMEYKSLSKQPHWDITSKQYVHSERDELIHRQGVSDYNEVIDQFKRDLELQRQIIKELNNMERPYLKNGQKGNTKNYYDEVKDYSENKQVLEQDVINKYMENLANKNFTINNSQFFTKYPILQHEKDLQRLKENRPVNSHFHQDKGSKFDVEIPDDEKHEHVADRLGHPEIFLTPLETLIRSDRILAHPGFQNQPFIKMPRAEPDDSVNFEQGEVIYHNAIAKDWTAFINANSLILPFYHLFNSLYFLHDETPDAEFSNFFERTLRSYDIYSMDNFGTIYISLFGLSVGFLYCVNGLVASTTKPFIHSIQYSKNEDLIFVKYSNWLGCQEEMVYEVDHIERSSPYIKTLIHLEDQGKDGYTKLRCLNSNHDMVVSNNDKFWKEGQKEKFMQRISNLLSKEYVRDGLFEIYGDAARAQN